jgi:hypothetical protein
MSAAGGITLSISPAPWRDELARPAAESSKLAARFKRTAAYADLLWQRWPTEAHWPAVLDLYEAAAFRRVDYKTIWKACKVSRTDGRAQLAHQRFGASYRITKAALQRFGAVQERGAA